MEAVDSHEIWRQIAPEEKFELMARAQSKGVLTSLTVIIAAASVAIGLKIPWLFWASLGFAPLLFQGTAAKAWRSIKPSTMLEYLAARSATRRYAFSHNAKDLSLATIFRGYLSEEFSEDERSEALAAAFAHQVHENVWVTLFYDCVVLIAERAGGAELKFAHVINDKIEVSSEGSEYSQDHVTHLLFTNRDGEIKRFKITSDYPAALIVFEKRLQTLIKRFKEVGVTEIPPETDEAMDSIFAAAAGSKGDY